MADQPVPSSSSARASPRQLAGFIFDSALPRARFSALIQPDGIVPAVVKRLLEKHQGESDLRLEATVSPRLPRYSFQRGRVPAGSARLEAQSATNFFRRLSQLRVHFDASPTPSQADVQWPGFGLETQQEHGLYRKPSRKRKRREESALLEGVVSELESILVTSASMNAASPPQTLVSLCPPEAPPILTALYTPPPTPPPEAPSGLSRYVFLFAYEDGSESSSKKEEGPMVSGSQSDEWDGMTWEEVGARCGELGIKVSLVSLSNDQAAESNGRDQRLKGFVAAASSNPPTPPWFTLPTHTYTHFSSLSLPSIPVPAAPSTGVPRNSPLPAAAPLQGLGSPGVMQQQLQPNQMLAMRYLAQRASASGNSQGTAAAAANFMAAARNGSLDINDPQMQQIRQFLLMQQQMQQNQQNQPQPKPGPAMPIPVPQVPGQADGAGSGLSTDQELLAAMQRQRAIQALSQKQQAQAQGQVLGQGTTQGPNPAAAGTAQGGGNARGTKVWSGDIIWFNPGPGGDGASIRLTVDAKIVTSGYLTEPAQASALFPPELRFTSTIRLEAIFLQALVKKHNLPVVSFGIDATAADAAENAGRFDVFLKGLSSKGQVAVVPIKSQDRGILICPAPGSNNSAVRLLGVLCFTIPFPPSMKREAATAQQPQPQTQLGAGDTAALPAREINMGSVAGGPISLPRPYQPINPGVPPNQFPSNDPNIPTLGLQPGSLGISGPGIPPAAVQPPNANQNPAQQRPAQTQMSAQQLKNVMEQCQPMGVELPPGMTPTNFDSDQVKKLLSALRTKGMARQQGQQQAAMQAQMLLQQQQQQQQQQQLMMQQQYQQQAGITAEQMQLLQGQMGFDPRLLGGGGGGGGMGSLQGGGGGMGGMGGNQLGLQ